MSIYNVDLILTLTIHSTIIISNNNNDANTTHSNSKHNTNHTTNNTNSNTNNTTNLPPLITTPPNKKQPLGDKYLLLSI